jgi:hypothetical protein
VNNSILPHKKASQFQRLFVLGFSDRLLVPILEYIRCHVPIDYQVCKGFSAIGAILRQLYKDPIL